VVHPNLEVMSQTGIVMVVEQDGLLAGISIEPLTLWLEVYIGELISSIPTLAYTWWSPNPGASNCGILVGLSDGDLESIDGLLRLLILGDIDNAFFYGFLCSHLQKLCIASL